MQTSLLFPTVGNLCTRCNGYARSAEPTSRLLRVLNSIRSWSLVKASLEYWKLNVENGVSGSSKMSKSAKSFSFSVSRGTPESELNQIINNTLGSFYLLVTTESFLLLSSQQQASQVSLGSSVQTSYITSIDSGSTWVDKQLNVKRRN